MFYCAREKWGEIGRQLSRQWSQLLRGSLGGAYKTQCWVSLVDQMVKNLPVTQEIWFNPWVEKIPWRREWLPTPGILAWRIPWTEEPGGLQSMGCKELNTIE